MTTDQPFYFGVVFWGAAHRGYFVQFLLASLMSPANIPLLAGESGHKFLIATTRTDWDALQDEPLFQAMRAYCEPVLLEIPMPHPDDPKMRIQSSGHRLMSERFFADRAYGLYLTPDMLLADGTIRQLKHLASQGCKVVLCVAIRFAHDEVEAALAAEGYAIAGNPTVIGPRDLMRIGLANLHTETRCYEFTAPWLAQSPIAVYWQVPQGAGIIIYSFSWCPLLVDYAALHSHDTQTFDEWTLDGDYIHRNFPSPSDVHIVTDSDDICMVSLTREEELHFDLVPKPGRTGLFAKFNKFLLIRELWASHVIDDLKRDIFSTPVYLHYGDLSPVWSKAKKETMLSIIVASGQGGGGGSGIDAINLFLYLKLIMGPYKFFHNIYQIVVPKIGWLYCYRRFVVQRALWKFGFRCEKPEFTDPVWLDRTPGFAHPITALEHLLGHHRRKKKRAK